MKPILYIEQQIMRSHETALKISKYIDKNRTLRKSDLRELMKTLYYHLAEASNTVSPPEINHETDEERNALPHEV